MSMLNSKTLRKNYSDSDFEITLAPEDNERENPNESYTNKYQKHNACIYGYKLVYVDDKFIKPFK